MGFYATKPIPRRSISENTFLLNRSGERRATNGSPDHSRSPFNIKTTWRPPGSCPGKRSVLSASQRHVLEQAGCEGGRYDRSAGSAVR